MLRTGWKIGGALLIGTAVYTAYEALRPLTTGASAGPIEVGPISSFAVGKPTYVPAGRLYMVNLGQKIVALSQKCPHLGCRVDFCESSGWFQCPCHGSKYDVGGEWIEGPAPRGLDEYPDVTLAEDKKTVIVDTSKVEPGPPRGANQYYTPRKGPNC